MATHKIVVETSSKTDQIRRYTLDRNIPSLDDFEDAVAHIDGLLPNGSLPKLGSNDAFWMVKRIESTWEEINLKLFEIISTWVYPNEEKTYFHAENLLHVGYFGLEEKDSNVNPSHYASSKVTPIDLIEAYDLNFNLGNVIKYTARAKQKNGREDLCKATWYLLNELGVPRLVLTELTEYLSAEETTADLYVDQAPKKKGMKNE